MYLKIGKRKCVVVVLLPVCKSPATDVWTFDSLKMLSSSSLGLNYINKQFYL